MERLNHACITLVVIFLTIGTSAQVLAQVDEVEPNDSCPAAQNIGAIDVADVSSVTGSLDTPPDEPDVDFFRFSATPSARLVVDLEGEATGQGTLPDPLLGLFDSACDPLASDDDGGVAPNSRLSFGVPADGVFVLAATSWPDFGFTGDGDSSGSYTLTISPAPPSIGSIAGRIVDALSGQPLAGDQPPFASAELYGCEDGDCFEFMDFQSADGEGRFRFDPDVSFQGLPAGTYQVLAFAEQYQSGQTDPFEVGEDEDFDVGDIALRPPPIGIAEVLPCEELLPQGGTCRYAVRLVNNTSAPLRGLAWSLVEGFGLGSTLDFTEFEASARRGDQSVARPRVSLDARGEDVLGFRFAVPSFVRDGAIFCARIHLGLNPAPLLNTISSQDLFCIEKGAFGFEVMSDAESHKMFRQSDRESRRQRSLRARRDGGDSDR